MKNTLIAIALVAVIFGGVMLLKNNASSQSANTGGFSSVSSVNNVTVENGKQIITINTKGGYQPERSIAKAGMPTVLRFATNGTFDCSSSIRIPSMGITKVLPQTGNTDIDVGTPQVATLQGTCGMGMYRFEVDFQG